MNGRAGVDQGLDKLLEEDRDCCSRALSMKDGVEISMELMGNEGGRKKIVCVC